MGELSYRCKRTVVSSKEVQPGKFHQLSLLDHTMELHSIRIVLYYRFPTKSGDREVTKKLMESLSEVLTSFPVVTGRLQRTPEGQWKIKCNDAGVRMVEATVKGSVEDWLQVADREQELRLAYWEDMFHDPYFWSTFYVQITEFEGDGVAIGLSCSHLLADATSATMLLKAWAETTFLNKMLLPPYFHPFPPRNIPNHKPNTDFIDYYELAMSEDRRPPSSNPDNLATVTLSFTEEMVRSCMAEAKSGPFEALAALLWVGVCNAKGNREGLLDMSLCLDVRDVMSLSNALFGNGMVFSKVCGEEIKKSVGLVEAAKAIGDVVKNIDKNGIMDLIEWLESDMGGRRKLTHHLPVLSGPQLVCANWENLCPYAAIFDAGVRPIHASYYFERAFGEGHILILPSPKSHGCLGRVAMVTLPKEQAKALCEEPLILGYSPNFLMAVQKTQS